MPESNVNPPRKIALIGSYVPRECGIATFTSDLADALSANNSRPDVMAVAMNDRQQGYAYPDRVRYEIDVDDLAGYRQAAEFLNIAEVDVLSLQHEFRIFGGDEGSHIEMMLKHLRVPTVATLHTVLTEPTLDQRNSMEILKQYCDRFVVMSDRGVKMLKETFDVDPNRIDMIYHGIPDVAFVDPNFYRDQYDLEGRKVLLTFGLLSPTKGLENVIEAMPQIVERHPEAIYVILGKTHPNERKRDGESYREALKQRVSELGMEDHVRFHDAFVEREELIRFLILADIYITPYLAREQITSGTLAYSFGAGKAVVSTPYWHAEELLADGRGRLVPFRDPDAIAEHVIDLLDDPR
ncbi:MAG: glycosyltransferase family 4 protein, partial [Planctomycetota bacterium]